MDFMSYDDRGNKGKMGTTMKKIYNKKNDIRILQDMRVEIKADADRIAVVINLFYEESLKQYEKYILNIPPNIDIFFFSSNLKMLEMLRDRYHAYSNVSIFEKENRGRDVSALLVSFRPYVSQYDYICFLHDKKEKYEHLKADVNFWCENLWGNMLASEGYIWNAIDMMKSRHYGILLPPKPIGKYMDTMYADAWENNFDNVVLLAQKLGLDIDVKREDEDLLAIGTVFWCSVAAMKKLFTYDWKYEDFVDEPMPGDGTVSHAIERILGFVALDADYQVGTIMNCDYAAKLHRIMQKKLEMTYGWLLQRIGIKNTQQLSSSDQQEKVVAEIYKKWKKIYLYGAGYFGEIYLKRIQFWGYEPAGFIVSDGERHMDEYNGYRVYELREIQNFDNTAIIITVSGEHQKSIVDNLKKAGVSNYYILD